MVTWSPTQSCRKDLSPSCLKLGDPPSNICSKGAAQTRARAFPALSALSNMIHPEVPTCNDPTLVCGVGNSRDIL